MIKENEKIILNRLNKKDLVLDIGGWDKPFNRSNFVLDIHPYKTRGFHGGQGGNKEHFNKKTWILHDVCSRKKLPFKDHQFDFVICSHVLEDIRDPVWLCSEIMRIGKAGYIEFPSIESELTKGIMSRSYVGYYHHRWLIEIINNRILFRFKPHFIHNDKRFYFPKRFLKNLNEDRLNSYFFWTGKFEFNEVIQISRDQSQKYINDLIKHKGYRKNITVILDFIGNINVLYKKLKKKFIKKTYCHRIMNVPEFYSS